MKRRIKASEQTIGWRLGYRVDRFLSLHPAMQVISVLVASAVVTAIFGVLVRYLDDSAPEQRVGDVGGGLWWSLTRMLDGGTVASDTGLGLARRFIGVVVTVIGLAAVALLTGSLASSFTDRLRALRAGSLPVFERNHVVLLGYNSHAGVIIRELALSGSAITIVVVADQDRELIEENLREQLGSIVHRLVIVVRRGDPTTTASARRAACKKARVVLVLPDTDRSVLADRTALRALLAVKRIVGRKRVPIIVEVATPTGLELIRLVAGADEVTVVEGRDINARFVAQSVRQRGTFDVARQILSLDERSIYFHPTGELTGQSFDEAHAAVEGGVLIGFVREGKPHLSPDGATALKKDDKLLVFSDNVALTTHEGKLPDCSGFAVPPAAREPPKLLRLLVLRYRPELAAILEFLDERGPVRAKLIVHAHEIDRVKDRLALATLARTEIDIVEGDTLDSKVTDAALDEGFDVVLLLAPEVAIDVASEADADQLITLLYVRRRSRSSLAGESKKPKRERVVVEVRSPETAKLATGLASPEDFVLSREIVGMLVAQELHAICLENQSGAWIGPAYHRILEAIGPAVELVPMETYAGGHASPSFAELASRVRCAGKIAIGVQRTGARALLLPSREERFEAGTGAKVVLLNRVDR